MKQTDKTWDTIYDNQWRPYGQKVNHIMKSLHNEKFNPFDTGLYSFKTYNMEGQETRTLIEAFILNHFDKMFNGTMGFLNDFKDEDAVYYKTHIFNHNAKQIYHKSWFLFLKRLGQEFNIDYNNIKFSHDPEYKTPKNTNLLGKLNPYSTPMACYFSVVQLGVNPFALNSEYLISSLNKDTNPFFKFIRAEKKLTTTNAVFLDKMLSHSLDFLNVEEFEYSFFSNPKNPTPEKFTNLFSIISERTLDERNEMGLILYKHFKNDMQRTISTENLTLPEKDIYHFLQQYCPAAFSLMQKESISNMINLNIKPNTSAQRL